MTAQTDRIPATQLSKPRAGAVANGATTTPPVQLDPYKPDTLSAQRPGN